MPRSRRRKPARRAAVRAARPRSTARPPRPKKPVEAETRLLALAREVTALPRDTGDTAALAAALRALAAAHAPDGVTPRAVYGAWLASRGDKTAALALAWAREQVRLALQETIERARPPRRVDVAPDTLAWLLLAACESLAHEPPSAVADRLRALLLLTGHAEADR
jgi:hypothetical protein